MSFTFLDWELNHGLNSVCRVAHCSIVACTEWNKMEPDKGPSVCKAASSLSCCTPHLSWGWNLVLALSMACFLYLGLGVRYPR